MKKYIFLLAVAAMTLGIAAVAVGADEKPLIIDVRTEAEWNKGHLEGAILIPYTVIGEKIGSVAKDKSRPVYVYCRTGRRSQIAKETLEKLGYRDVRNLGSLEEAAKRMNIKIVK